MSQVVGHTEHKVRTLVSVTARCIEDGSLPLQGLLEGLCLRALRLPAALQQAEPGRQTKGAAWVRQLACAAAALTAVRENLGERPSQRWTAALPTHSWALPPQHALQQGQPFECAHKRERCVDITALLYPFFLVALIPEQI